MSQWQVMSDFKSDQRLLQELAQESHKSADGYVRDTTDYLLAREVHIRQWITLYVHTRKYSCC